MGCVTFKNSKIFHKDDSRSSGLSKSQIFGHPKHSRTVRILKKSRFLDKLGSFQRSLNVIYECPSEAEVSLY